MKKVFISAALFAALFCSCSTENHDMINDIEETTANVSFFDESYEEKSPFQRAQNHELFLKSMEKLISTFGDFDYFRDVLPRTLLPKIDAGTYTENEGVFTLYLWWKNDRCGDVLVEWDVWDDFIANLPDIYFAKYGFYW